MITKFKSKLQQISDPKLRRTIVDEKGEKLFELTDEEMELLMRVENGQFATKGADQEYAYFILLIMLLIFFL
jgi:hypothetical protein